MSQSLANIVVHSIPSPELICFALTGRGDLIESRYRGLRFASARAITLQAFSPNLDAANKRRLPVYLHRRSALRFCQRGRGGFLEFAASLASRLGKVGALHHQDVGDAFGRVNPRGAFRDSHAFLFDRPGGFLITHAALPQKFVLGFLRDWLA